MKKGRTRVFKYISSQLTDLEEWNLVDEIIAAPSATQENADSLAAEFMSITDQIASGVCTKEEILEGMFSLKPSSMH